MYKVLKTKVFCDTITVWKTGHIVLNQIEKARYDTYNPRTVKSKNYKEWVTQRDERVCLFCEEKNGTIYKVNALPHFRPPIHFGCRCYISFMHAIVAGTATKDGEQGADWYLKYIGSLPSYYIGEKELESLGWSKGDKPAKFASGKMLGGEIYRNEDGKLPQKAGRIWYEADINYYEGVRNGHRILWSNDGLIFVTYNHYKNFYEII